MPEGEEPSGEQSSDEGEVAYSGGAYEAPAEFEGHTAFNPEDVQHIK